MATQPSPLTNRRGTPPPPPGFTEEVTGGAMPPPPPGFTEEVSLATRQPKPQEPPTPLQATKELAMRPIVAPETVRRFIFGEGRKHPVTGEEGATQEDIIAAREALVGEGKHPYKAAALEFARGARKTIGDTTATLTSPAGLAMMVTKSRPVQALGSLLFGTESAKATGREPQWIPEENRFESPIEVTERQLTGFAGVAGAGAGAGRAIAPRTVSAPLLQPRTPQRVATAAAADVRDLGQATARTATAMGRGVRSMAQQVKSVPQRLGLATPEATRAMQQALNPSVTIPKAKQSIARAGPELQRVREARGVEIRDTGNPGEALAAHADNVIEAKRALWQEYEQRLQPFEGFYERTHPVGRAMRDAVDQRTRTQYPEVAKRIDERARTYYKAMSLREIEDAIQSANNELTNWYKRSAADPGSVSPNIAASKAEVEALRGVLDQKLNSLTGASIRPFKELYGALRDVERATARQQFIRARQKGASLYEALGSIAAVGDLVSGSAWGMIKGAARMGVARRLTQLRNPDYLIEQAYHGKRAFAAGQARPSYTPPIGGTWIPPAPPTAPTPPGATGAVVMPLTAAGRRIAGALPPMRPAQLKPGVAIPAGPARSTPPPPIEPPPPVNVSAATAQPWPKMLSVNEVRAEAAKLRQQARNLQNKAATARLPQAAAKQIERANQLLERAKQLDDTAAQRARRTEEANAPTQPVAEAKETLSAPEMAVFRTLPARFGGAGVTADEIAAQANLPPAQLNSMLTDLEMRGIIGKKPGGRFVANRAPDAVAEAAAPKAVKEPWQMSYDEWAATQPSRSSTIGMYQAMIRGAVREGKPVPSEIASQYGGESALAKAAREGREKLQGARQGMSSTYEALAPEQRANVDALVKAYKESDFYGKQNIGGPYNLKRSSWTGLPIEEKFARAMKERGEI